jgi:hypothetical protein
MKPLANFKVWVSPRDKAFLPYFFWCTIWRDIVQARKRMMQMEANKEDPAVLAAIANSAGACYSWKSQNYRPGHDGDLSPCIGEIVLAESWSGSSTIAHECSHAAFRLGELIAGEGIVDNQEVEERHCLTVGYMTRQIVARLIKIQKQAKNG